MDEPSTSPVDEPGWYCVRTKTKREHLAAKSLDRLEGVKAFCPRLRYRKATRRGKIWWVEAMFPGYIFAFFSRKQSERDVIHTQGVMTLLKFGDYVPEIPASFVAELIQQIESAEGEDSEVLTLTPTVNQGDEVELAHGALQGFQGKVVEVLPAQERVKVLVEFLGNHQVVETDLFSLILPDKPLPE